MERGRFGLTVLAALAILAAYQLVRVYPLLPERIAVHFGPEGRPDGWSGRLGFVLLYGAIEAVLVAFAAATSRFADRLPTHLWNLPNRDYWLAPERRRESVAFVARTVVWIENATLVFLIALAEIVFRANLAHGPTRLPLPTVWAILVAFVAALTWLVVRIYARFRKPLIAR